MPYWRMQLHPAEPGEALRYAVESLAAGYIGLDFGVEVGGLTQTTQTALPENQKDYWAFAHGMAVGDRVLITVHHFPFALVRVAGEYNHIRSTAPKIGVWFRHFRRVDDVTYYGDFRTDVRQWEQLRMTDTISPLRDPGSRSYRLVQEWSHAA